MPGTLGMAHVFEDRILDYLLGARSAIDSSGRTRLGWCRLPAGFL
jgi:hypothetical protein